MDFFSVSFTPKQRSQNQFEQRNLFIYEFRLKYVYTVNNIFFINNLQTKSLLNLVYFFVNVF